VAEILSAHGGRIDNLVTSAGFTENFEAVHYGIDRVRKLWGVNVDGTFLFATAVARHLVSFFSLLILIPCSPSFLPCIQSVMMMMWLVSITYQREKKRC